MAYYRCGGGGLPAGLQTDMDAVLNKKFSTSTTYPPADWPDTVNLMGPLPEKTIVSSPIADFQDGADDVPTKSLIVTIPATLSGVSTITETQTGRNLLLLNDGTYTIGNTGATATILNGEISVNGTTVNSGGRTTRLSDYFILHAGTYYISPVISASPYVRSYLNKKSDNTVVGYSSGSAFTVSEDTEVYFGINIESGKTYDTTLTPQLEFGSTAHAYEPYQTPTTYSANLGRTIHGGYADLVNGDGVDSGVKYTLDGTQTVTMFSTTDANVKRFSVSIPNDSITTTTDRTDIISDVLPTATNAITSAGGKGIHYRTNGSHNVIVCFGSDVSLSSEAEYNAYVSEHNIEIVYTLATPTGYTFDGQEINTRLGYNAFWSDQGDTEVTYRADINLALGGQ